MFFKRIKLFRLLGFEVRIDLSWLLLAALIVWTLAAGYFPGVYRDLPRSTYWIMGVLGAVGLFLSIIIHEFSHSIVARSHGLPMKGITLFIFGGVAEMGEEPPSARTEFLMAAVGPLTSILLAGVFYAVYLVGAGGLWPEPFNGVIGYLALINVVLALFNLVPAFPLDGGRMLRALLWKAKDNLRWATRVSAGVGTGFGVLLVVLGVLEVFQGNFIGGMWFFLIGMFVQGAAKGSYQHLLARRALEGEPIRRFMKADPVTVPPSATVEELVEDYVYKHHFKMYPVVEEGRLLGCVTTKGIKEVGRDAWRATRVGDISSPCTPENSIGPDADALEALSIMNRARASRLLVQEGQKLLGIVTLKDLLGFIALKVDLEE